jgi:hypothetical protein
MRKAVSWGLIVVGAFLLVIGLLLRFYASDAVKKTPLSVTSKTYLSGTADKLNPATGEIEALDVKVLSDTRTDDEASDDDVAVFVNSTCAVKDEPGTPDCVDADDPEERLISATTDVFATDRTSALSLSDEEDDDYLPSDAVTHEGLVNKWPFDAERKDYPYWDGMLGEAVTAEYIGTEELKGLEVYAYQVTVEEAPANVAGDIEGLYSAEKTLYIDPRTGSIIKQVQRDVRTLENGDPVLDLQVEFTDEQVQANVDAAEEDISSLRLVGVIGPIVGVVLGLVLLGLGIVLVLRDRRSQGGAHS